MNWLMANYRMVKISINQINKKQFYFLISLPSTVNEETKRIVIQRGKEEKKIYENDQTTRVYVQMTNVYRETKT